ncbi:hypothetical protein EVAR_83767_1 [Eumeta japonica]|uniref:Endonuclease/exonuclease/phosphatase domain-containing protein n=1 Tax=Eumeta variegata TaxID=151549 RepID=A0A4C1WEN9_EUMVA|nr:hypothetical protein EVAR_83767_1 [Eumeta japonica]
MSFSSTLLHSRKSRANSEISELLTARRMDITVWMSSPNDEVPAVAGATQVARGGQPLRTVPKRPRWQCGLWFTPRLEAGRGGSRGLVVSARSRNWPYGAGDNSRRRVSLLTHEYAGTLWSNVDIQNRCDSPPSTPSPTRAYAAVAASFPHPKKNTLQNSDQTATPEPSRMSNDADTNANTPTTPNAAASTRMTTQRVRGCPPIVVENLPNWVDSLQRATTVQRYLQVAAWRDHQVTWFYYALEIEKLKKVGILGLPVDIASDMIVAALQELNFPAKYDGEGVRVPPNVTQRAIVLLNPSEPLVEEGVHCGGKMKKKAEKGEIPTLVPSPQEFADSFSRTAPEPVMAVRVIRPEILPSQGPRPAMAAPPTTLQRAVPQSGMQLANTGGIFGKTQDIRTFVQSQDIHIILLGETKLRSGLELLLRNFFVYRRDEVSPRSIAYRDNTPTILAGDLNAKHTVWGSRVVWPPGRKFSQDAEDYGYEVLGPDTLSHVPMDPRFGADVLNIVICHRLPFSIHVGFLNDMDTQYLPILITLGTTAHLSHPRQQTHRTNWSVYQRAL